MTNPFITDRANYDLSNLEREYRKRPEDKWIKDNLPPRKCVNTQVSNATTFNDLGEFVGTFDLNLLTQLSILKISSVSPVNFNDFLAYLDQTISYFSCIFSANLDTINNKSPKGKSFDWGAFALSIPFDFFKAYGIGLFKLLERLALEIVKKVFLEILDVVDCDKIDKCIVPCDPSDNPYQKLFVKPLIKESKGTGLFFAKKILDGKFDEKGFDITDEEMKEYANKAISRLAPDELECLLKGFMSTSVVQFLIDLFKDHTGHDVTESIINTVFTDIQDVVDLVPYTPSRLENNICGIISMESVARMRLQRQGYSEQEITNRLNIVIQESGERLETITDFLRQLPNSPPDLDQALLYDEEGNEVKDDSGNSYINGNSLIVSSVINAGIELIFNSIGVNNLSANSSLMSILVNPLGEMCLAYYWINWGTQPSTNNNSINIGSSNISNPFNGSDFVNLLEKINYQVSNETSLIDFVINSPIGGSERFFEKYKLQNVDKFKGYFVKYVQNGDIHIFMDGIVRFIIKQNTFIDFENDNTIAVSYSNIPETYTQLTNRNNIKDLFSTYNSGHLLSSGIDILESEPARILEDIYNNIFEIIDTSMVKKFFFEELFPNSGNPLRKKKFSNIDYFNISQTIEELKVRINA